MSPSNSSAAARKPGNVRTSPNARTSTPRPSPSRAPSKPHLELAPQPKRFRKLFIAGVTLGLLGLVAIPFAIVFLHAALLTGQRDLDHLRQDLNTQLELRQQLLFERSLAVSPQRIITIARDQLGMISAENIVYLQSAAPSISSPAAYPASTAIVPQSTS